MADSPKFEADALGVLARGLAHEYSNLLGVAIGNLQLAETAIAEDGDRVEIDRWVQRALEATGRAVGLTRSLSLVGARPTREPRTLRVHSLLRELEPLLAAVLGSRVRLEQTLCPGDPEVTADPGELAAKVLRLLVSARDASPESETVTLRTERRVLAQGDTQRSHTQQLYRCLAISTGDDASSAVVLPCLDMGEGAEALPPGVAPASAPGARVLIYDPARSSRESAVPWLQQLGYAVNAVAAIEQVLALLRRDPPDVLLVDVDAPGGAESLQLARSARALAPGIAVGLLSGNPGSLAQVRDGALPTLSTPYRQAELAAFLRDLPGAGSRSHG